MYGDKLTTQYGRENGRRRGVVGEITTAPIGNLSLRFGKLWAPEGQDEPKGWEVTEFATLFPSEGFALAAEIVETLIGHEENADLIRLKVTPLVELENLVKRLKEIADDVEVAEKDAGRRDDEEIEVG